ncbi:MAG: class I SAM-dependent methyltransferase, partial [Anaerolineae bacterium]|nr:class I SAM-dependent methyltransferase [Anaerolineae bacterium]
QRYFWDRVYDRYARLYDAVDWFTFNTTHKYRLKILDFLPQTGTSLLEIGPGTGKLHCILASRYHTSGLDRAMGMLHMARWRLQQKGLSSHLCRGDVYHIPWPAQTFDLIVLSFAFSAFPDGHRAFHELYRVLKNNGSLIILDAGVSDNRNWFAVTLAKIWEIFGDSIRDERLYMRAKNMKITYQEFGPGGCVHIVAGVKSQADGLQLLQ